MTAGIFIIAFANHSAINNFKENRSLINSIKLFVKILQSYLLIK